MSFGRREYAYMAAHMAMSIKFHNEELQIHLIHDDSWFYTPQGYNQFIDGKTRIKDNDLKFNALIDPGWAKINLYNYLPFDENIFLDVDGVCINDLADVFNMCENDYHCEVIGSGGKKDKIEYSIWATNENLWSEFGLDDNQIVYAVQSSFQYYKKTEMTKEFHRRMIENFKSFNPKRLAYLWGGSLPDELIIQGTLGQMKYDPTLPKRITYFGNKKNRKSIPEIKEKYWVSSLYGNGGASPLVSQTYIAWYDRLIINYGRKYGLRPIQKAFQLLRKKHVT